jgi:hypothetical protein
MLPGASRADIHELVVARVAGVELREDYDLTV